MDPVERLLGHPPVERAVRPGRLGSGAAVREAGVDREVIALTVVGLDALDPELEHGPGKLPPPGARLLRGEVDDRSGPHPPAPDMGAAVAVADEVIVVGPLLVVRRGLTVQ